MTVKEKPNQSTDHLPKKKQIMDHVPDPHGKPPNAVVVFALNPQYPEPNPFVNCACSYNLNPSYPRLRCANPMDKKTRAPT